MNPSDVLESMRGLPSRWPALLFNYRGIRQGSTITWSDCERQRLPHTIYAQNILQLAENRQYTYQLADGSLLQLYYEFNNSGRKLLSASLAYLRYDENIIDEIILDDTAEESDDMEDNETQITEDSDSVDSPSEIAAKLNINMPAAWLRIDYAPSESRGCIHSKCHLHLSIAPSVRIPINGVPTPDQFVEAITAWFYPEEYSKARLDDSGNFTEPERLIDLNRPAILAEVEEAAKSILHITVPSAAHLTSIVSNNDFGRKWTSIKRRKR